MNTSEVYFTEAPAPTELLGYMAGGLRDCIDYCGDEALDIQAAQLFAEFGGEAGFKVEREDEDALELATRMTTCLDAIASCDSAESSVRMMSLTNAEAFRQGIKLIESER